MLPDGEVRDLYVVDGTGHLRAAGRAPRPRPRAGSCPAWSTRTATSGSTTTGRSTTRRPRQQAIDDRDAGALLIRDSGSAADTALDPRARRPAAADPRRPAHRADQALHPQLRPRGRAATTWPRHVAQEAQRGDGWVKLVGDWISREDGRPGAVVPRGGLRGGDRGRARARRQGHRALLRRPRCCPGCIDAGIDCIEHGTGLTTDLIEQMVAHGIALVPTVMQLDKFPEYAEAGARALPDVRRDHDRPARAPPRHDHGGLRRRGRALRRLRRRGSQPARQHRRRGARAGRPRDARGVRPRRRVLAGPRLAGLERHPRRGRPADFVVYPRDPLDDLAVLRAPTRIVLRGRVVR